MGVFHLLLHILGAPCTELKVTGLQFCSVWAPCGASSWFWLYPNCHPINHSEVNVWHRYPLPLQNRGLYTHNNEPYSWDSSNEIFLWIRLSRVPYADCWGCLYPHVTELIGFALLILLFCCILNTTVAFFFSGFNVELAFDSNGWCFKLNIKISN